MTRRAAVAIIAAILLLLAAILFGVWQLTRAAALRAALGDVYHSALLDTQTRLSEIEIQLSKLQVSGSAEQSVRMLSSVARGAGEMTANLALVPLSHVAMGDALKFANQLSDYSDTLLIRLAAGEALDASDEATLKTLSQKVGELSTRFTEAMDGAAAQDWMAARERDAFYQEADAGENALGALAGGRQGYPTLIYDGPFSDARHAGKPLALPEFEVSGDEIAFIAMNAAGGGAQSAEHTADQGGDVPAAIMTVRTRDNSILVAVTKRGGLPLWMSPESASFEIKLELSECKALAADALQRLGFDALEATYWQIYDGMAVINFAAVQDGVLLYPDLVKAQVRMDTGELVGLEAMGYVMNHAPREALKALITPEDARSRVNARLSITGERLCVIPEQGGESLCYEFTGMYDGETYLVYIDARTGQEKQILRLIDHKTGLLTA